MGFRSRVDQRGAGLWWKGMDAQLMHNSNKITEKTAAYQSAILNAIEIGIAKKCHLSTGGKAKPVTV